MARVAAAALTLNVVAAFGNRPTGQLVLNRGASTLLTAPGGANIVTNQRTLRYVQALAIARGCTTDVALGFIAFQGARILVATRSEAMWTARNSIENIPPARAFSQGAANWLAVVALLIYFFDAGYFGGRDVPRHGPALAALFMAAMTQLRVIDAGDPYSVGGVAAQVGITATEVGIFACLLALSQQRFRRQAAMLSRSLGFGYLALAACIFGCHGDTIALTGRITADVIGNQSAYSRVCSVVLPEILASLLVTVRAMSLLVRLYQTGEFRMGLRYANNGVDFDASGDVVRGHSPWLVFPYLPVALMGIRATEGFFGVSTPDFGLIYESFLMIFICISTNMYNNMGTWNDGFATNIVVPTPVRGILTRGIKCLLYFLYGAANAVPPPDPYDPDPLPDDWWLSLVFSMCCMICVWGPIPDPNELGIDPATRARRVTALDLLNQAVVHPHISVYYPRPGFVLVVFMPFAGIQYLGDFWSAPTTMEDIMSNHIRLDDPALLQQVPPYEDRVADLRTGALEANRRGAARRNEFRDRAGRNPHSHPGLI